ncbi:MAG: MMPL family transporter, partial [Nocardioides sp.]|nr:MMPL family transporter [Nocardioides sp.]
MATLLYRLGKTAFRRWPLFIAAWLLAMVAVGGFAATMSKPMTDSFSIPGIPSEKASDLQAELFPDAVDAFDQASVKVVVAAPEGSRLGDPAYADQVDALIEDLSGLPQMPETPLTDPVTAAAEQRDALLQAATDAGTPRDVAVDNAEALSPLSEDGRVGTITWDFDVETIADVEPATIEALGEVMADARGDGLQVEANGAGSVGMSELDGTAELVGIAVALLVLVLTFGSLIAAG